MFDRIGMIEYDAKAASDDAMLEAAIEAGADDVISSERRPRDLRLAGNLSRRRQGAGSEIRRARKAALTWKPQNTVAVDDETGEKLLKLIDLLERA